MSAFTIASSEGGPGKTTLCQRLVGILAGELRPALLEADPDQAVSRWARTLPVRRLFRSRAPHTGRSTGIGTRDRRPVTPVPA